MENQPVASLESARQAVPDPLGWAEERRELSREMHDQIAHSILTVLTSLELLELHEKVNETRAQESLSRAKRSAGEALDSIRSLAARLRAPVGRARDGWNDQPTAFNPEVPPEESRHETPADPPNNYDQLFLVLREAVHNAVTHARADRVDVDVRVDGDWIDAVVEDDGDGFEPQRLPPAKCVGLASMSERTVRVGGRFHIASQAHQGTRVNIGMPYRGATCEHG